MTNDQFNHFDMYKTVLALLKDEAAVVEKYTAFGEHIPLFEASIVRARILNRDYNNATKGLTQSKHYVREAVYRGLVPVKAALKSISSKISDQKLKAMVLLTDSEFKKLREEKFIETGSDMIAAAKANAALLGGFRLTTEKLDALQAKLDEFSLKKDEQGTGFSSRNSLWISLNDEFDKLNEIVTEHLDAVALNTRDDEPDFYNKYKAVRIIKDLGGKRGGDDDEDTPPENPPENK